MNTKNIKPYNDKGQRHGLWEVYYDNGSSGVEWVIKGRFINNKQVGLWEDFTVGFSEKTFHIT